MDSQRSPLGACSSCETDIPPGQLLIEYETANDTVVYAECPNCGGFVTPE